MTYKILDSKWYTPPFFGMDAFQSAALGLTPAVGVVAIQSGPDNDKWKCYLGIVSNDNIEANEQSIAGSGVKVSKEVACAHFPELPAEGFVF